MPLRRHSVYSFVRFTILSLAALVVCTAAFADDGPIFRFTEKPGPHAVGFRVVEQYDYSRTYRRSTDSMGKPYQGERARPVQTLLWYPAQRTSGNPMTFGDYVNLWATETNFGHPNMPAKGKEWLHIMAPALSTVLWGVRDAPVAAGHFPVIVYAPGASGMAWENADLCEYLASYGYVVLATPDMGTTTRGVTIDVPGAGELARDISFLIGYAESLPDADISQVAVAGMSWGGIANVFAAARDSRITALIGLDGSARYFPGVVQQAGDVHPDQMMIPMIYFEQSDYSIENENRSAAPSDRLAPNVLNEWTHGDLITVRMLGLQHGSYTVQWQRNQDLWKYYADSIPVDFWREDGSIQFGWVSRYTLAFVDAYLKHDANALAYLKKKPAENGVPLHTMAIKFRPASGIAPSFDGFRTEIGRQGFDHAADIYAAFRNEKSDFSLDQGALGDWINNLINENHLPEATTLIKLDLQMHPESAGAYETLGDVCLMSGDKSSAIENYKKAAAKDPTSGSVKRKLDELSAGR
jgi:dienelactone hydrolase